MRHGASINRDYVPFVANHLPHAGSLGMGQRAHVQLVVAHGSPCQPSVLLLVRDGGGLTWASFRCSAGSGTGVSAHASEVPGGW